MHEIFDAAWRLFLLMACTMGFPASYYCFCFLCHFVGNMELALFAVHDERWLILAACVALVQVIGMERPESLLFLCFDASRR